MSPKMRPILVLALCLATLGCAEQTRSVQIAAAPPAPAPQEVDGAECYTVELFDKVKVQKPARDVPPEYTQFLGKWEKGAWNNLWCHDLLVTSVTKDGTVEVFDMHGPYDPWGQPASAFKRVGKIEPDGQLRFANGSDTLSYRLEGARLHGTRAGKLGTLTVELRQAGRVPLPTPKPLALAAAAAAPTQLAAATPLP